MFTESDERCGLTAELDCVKKEGVPLPLDLDILEDAQTAAGARAQLKEALRLYFRKGRASDRRRGDAAYLYRDCVFRVSDGVKPPKAGSLFFCRQPAVRSGERVLEIGAGLGLAAVLAARAGHGWWRTDIVPAAVESIRANAAAATASRSTRGWGDSYAPVPASA